MTHTGTYSVSFSLAFLKDFYIRQVKKKTTAFHVVRN